MDDPRVRNETLVNKMVADGILRSADVERAFRQILRHQFLPDLPPPAAYDDEAIVTHQRGDGGEWISSSSQPTMMAIMLEQLQVGAGMRVLEIGAGTGFNAALLAELTQASENVWTVDVDDEFCAEARTHLAAAGRGGVHVVCADGWEGWPEAAPYDRIIVTASAYDIAPAWFTQLREGGVMVLPWGEPAGMQRSLAFQKRGGCLVQRSSHTCGFMRMRGRFERPEQSPSEAGAYHEHPWPVSPPPVSGTALDDLVYFLSLFLWPLLPVAYSQGETAETGERDRNRRLGLIDASRRIVTTVETDGPWKTLGAFTPATADGLETYTALWEQWGRPSPSELSLTAYPRGSAPEPEPGAGLARRKWFDYRVSRLGTILS